MAGWMSLVVDDQRGLTSVGLMLAVAFTLVVAVAAVHIFMYLYGQAAARAAIDEGVCAGSRVAAGEVVCEQRATEALLTLMPARCTTIDLDAVTQSAGHEGEERFGGPLLANDLPGGHS